MCSQPKQEFTNFHKITRCVSFMAESLRSQEEAGRRLHGERTVVQPTGSQAQGAAGDGLWTQEQCRERWATAVL